MMKLQLIFFLLICLIFSAKSQDTIKIYFNYEWEVVGEDKSANTIRVIPPFHENSDLRDIADYSIFGYLLEVSQSNVKSIEELTEKDFKKEGWRVKVDESGKIEQREFYKNDTLILQANYYDNQQLKDLHTYEDSKLKNEYNYYEDGNLEDSISYVYLGNKEHKYITSYHKNGVLERNDYYLDQDLVEGVCYDSLGIEREHIPYYEMPEFPGGNYGLNRYLSSVHYPRSALVDGIQGRVYISFVIDENGDVENAKIARGVDISLDMAALNQVIDMPKWKPGKKKGKPTKIKYTVPINFVLQ